MHHLVRSAMMIMLVPTLGLVQNVSAQSVGLKMLSQPTTVNLVSAKQIDVQASYGSTYRLFISVPSSAEPQTGWPVVYLTDANGNQPVVAEVTRRLARGKVQAIVVGIGYIGDSRESYLGQRCYDLTFPASGHFVENRLTLLKGRDFGGAERFLNFILEEVRPWLAANHNIDSDRQILAGHSFGGLFALYAALNRPTEFSGFLALSPSLWWADGGLQTFEANGYRKLAAIDDKPTLVVAVGERENSWPKHVLRREGDTAETGSMISQARAFVERVEDQVADMETRFFVVSDADHGSVYIPGMARGLAVLLQSAGTRKPSF